MPGKKLYVGAVLALSAFLCAGCYTPQTTAGVEILPEKLKSIAIPVFDNKTPYYSINEDITKKTIEKFIQNGRLTVTDAKTADCLLKGEVVQYWIVPLSYNENDVVEQKLLKVIVNLSLVDLQVGTVLWEETWRETQAGTEIGGIVKEVRFFVSGESEHPVETEEDARARIVEELAEETVKRTIYGW